MQGYRLAFRESRKMRPAGTIVSVAQWLKVQAWYALLVVRGPSAASGTHRPERPAASAFSTNMRYNNVSTIKAIRKSYPQGSRKLTKVRPDRMIVCVIGKLKVRARYALVIVR